MPRARLALAVLLIAVSACGSQPAPAPQHQAQPAPPAQTSVPATASTPSRSSSSTSYLPLPAVPFPPARPMDVVEAVFHFAADHPEVLSRIPCFCGCENRGHRHNDDCFVAARDERGRVTAWEPHGIGWEVCLDVAREAMQMHASGAPITAIRAAIEAEYRPHFPTMTPTPPIDR